MASYVVTYDLNLPGQNYSDLIEHLESYPNHWHFQKSAWIVGPAENAFDVANAAMQFLDAKDVLFVQALTDDSAWWGYDKAGAGWIAERVE